MINIRFPGGKIKCLTLSYDDGIRQDRRLISILDKYGIKATFNVNTGMFADKSDFDAQTDRMSAEEITALFKNSPHELAIHGLWHAIETELSPNLMVREVYEDRKNLEQLTGSIIRGMAYPFGIYNDELTEVLKQCGICYSRTCEDDYSFSLPKDWLRLKPTCHHRNVKLFDLCDSFLSQEPVSAKMFYLWGHSYEFDRNEPNNNWELIEEFAKKMGGHEDIWYATNIEIYDYIKAYENLRFSTDESIVYNPTVTKVYFTKSDKFRGETRLYTVNPGETLKLD